MQNSKLKRILQGTIWVSIYTGLFRLVTLLIAIMAARLLDVTDYGKVSVLQSTSALFIMFSTMGLGTVATKLVAEAHGRYVSVISLINVILCFAAAAFIFLGANWLADAIYQDTSLTYLFQILSVYVFFCGVTQIQSSVLAGLEDYSTISRINLVFGLASFVVVYLSIAKFGVNGWVYGLSAIEAGKAIAFKVIINRRFDDIRLRFEKAEFSYVSHLAIPIALSGIFILPVNWFVTRELLITTGYLDVALLNISEQWIAILTFFPIAVGNAMLPILSKMQSSDERQDISSLALKVNLGMSLMLSIPVAIVAEYILFLYGEQYMQGAAIFWYIVPLVVVLSLTNQLNNRVVADGRPALMMYSNLLWLVVCLPVAMLLLGMELGVAAILLARLAGYASKLIFLMYFSRKKVSA